MVAFPVSRYLAETARRDRGVAQWIPGLPPIVAGSEQTTVQTTVQNGGYGVGMALRDSCGRRSFGPA